MTRDDRIKALITDIKDIGLCIRDPKEWDRQEAIRELKRKEADDETKAV